MRVAFWAVCAAFALAAVSGAQTPQPAANLLINGDFEQGPAGPESRGKLPPGWVKSFISLDVVQVAAESRPGSAGKQCLQVDASEKVDGGGVFSALTPLDPARALRLSGWVKASGPLPKGNGAYFGVAWYDAEKKPICRPGYPDMNYTYVGGPWKEAAWTRLERAFQPVADPAMAVVRDIPANAAFFEVRVFALSYPRPVWFDDIAAAQEAPGQAEPTPKKTEAPSAMKELKADWLVAWKAGGQAGAAQRAAEAGATLARYMSQVLGVPVDAAPWQPNNARQVFLILDAETAAKEAADRLTDKRLDAFLIQYPARWEGKTVCMLVSHDSHAYDYPAYHFLTRFMDVHWVGPGDLGVVWRPQPDWKLPEKIDVLENPAFEMRLWSGESFKSREWLARSSRMGFHHALGHVFDPRKHGDKPEVFPIVGGKRYMPQLQDGRHYLGGWQPCTSHPKSIEVAVNHVVESFRANPQGVSVSLSVNDGAGNTCECEACRAQDPPDAFQPGKRPNLSDRFFRFYNTVVEKAIEQVPRAQVAVLGYGAVKEPPKAVRVHPKVHVFHVSPAPEHLKKWKDAGATPDIYEWLWDGGFLTVRPAPHIVADLVRQAHAMGGIGFYSEIIAHWAVGAPKFYVLAQVLWDPRRDTDAVLNEYFRLAYGEQAGPAVRAFFDTWWDIYRRRPEAEQYQMAWGWRGIEQFKDLRRDDLKVMDDCLARGRAAQASPQERQRLDLLSAFYQALRVNADEYLTGKELGDPAWLAGKTPEAVLAEVERASKLTAEFDRLWKGTVEADKTGWLLDARYAKEPESFWQQYVGQVRAMVSSARETAMDAALKHISDVLLKDRPKEGVIAWWEERMKERPGLAPYLGPQVNSLKGVVAKNLVVNGGFEEGQPGDPPTLPGWDFYEFYGMAKGGKAKYDWKAGGGRDGGRAIAFGEGRFPEMKAIIQLEAGRRYALSFWYKTVEREANASLTLFTYDGPLATPRNIEHEKIHAFMTMGLTPTEGEWRPVMRRFTAARSGVHVIQLASYYHKPNEWTWWDDVEIVPLW
jgi:hypothetical protein